MPYPILDQLRTATIDVPDCATPYQMGPLIVNAIVWPTVLVIIIAGILTAMWLDKK